MSPDLRKGVCFIYILSRRSVVFDLRPGAGLLQLGHQAVSCTNGTINWRQIYGDDAFRLKTPLYESDYQQMRKEKEIDFEALAKRAKEYAEVSSTLVMFNQFGTGFAVSCALRDTERIVENTRSLCGG